MATDDIQSAQQADKVSKPLLVENTKASHAAWQEAYEGASKPVKPCAPSPTYLKFIDKALEQAYAPDAFGDPKTVKHEFDCEIHTEDDAIRYAKLVLKRSGDPHTGILPPQENQEYAELSDPSYTGVDMEPSPDPRMSKPGHDQGLAVYRTYPDSAAVKAGLQTGDKIISVNSHDVTQLSFNDANAKLQGAAGTAAHLIVERNGEQFAVDAPRINYKAPSVTDASLPNNLAYICIEDFRNKHVPDQLRAALLKHKDAKGFVIDIRDNGGGYPTLGNLALSETMKDGTISTQRERNVKDTDGVSYVASSYELSPDGIVFTEKPEKAEHTFRLGDTNETITFDNVPNTKVTLTKRMENLVGERPVDILINGGTASTAEIFAGADRDTGNARLIGLPSFGKGIGGLYNKEQLPEGSGELVTNMRWFTPSGLWVGDAGAHRYGLQPDVKVANPFGVIPLTADDAQLIAAENDLNNRLRK